MQLKLLTHSLRDPAHRREGQNEKEKGVFP